MTEGEWSMKMKNSNLAITLKFWQIFIIIFLMSLSNSLSASPTTSQANLKKNDCTIDQKVTAGEKAPCTGVASSETRYGEFREALAFKLYQQTSTPPDDSSASASVVFGSGAVGALFAFSLCLVFGCGAK